MNSNRNKIEGTRKETSRTLPSTDNIHLLPLPGEPQRPLQLRNSATQPLPLPRWLHWREFLLLLFLTSPPSNDVRWYEITSMSWPYPFWLLQKNNSVLSGTRTPPHRKRLKHEYAGFPNRRVNSLTWFLELEFVCALTSMHPYIFVII